MGKIKKAKNNNHEIPGMYYSGTLFKVFPIYASFIKYNKKSEKWIEVKMAAQIKRREGLGRW